MNSKQDASRAKVFGIGFHKTATTSLAEALELLGYRVTGPNGIDRPNLAREALPMALELAGQYDAFQDNPWPLLYRELDARFPGSRFILTWRPPEQWIQSIVRHFGGQSTPMREWIYGPGQGDPRGREALYLERYQQHNREVRDHFKNRPGDFLEMDITRREGWETLCPFLGLPVPSVPFPHSNRANEREERNFATRMIRKLTRHVQRASARSAFRKNTRAPKS